MEIHEKLKLKTKVPTGKSKISKDTENQQTAKPSKRKHTPTKNFNKGNYSSISAGLEQFTEELCDKLNKTLLTTVAEKFTNIESQLYDCIQQSLNNIGKTMQKSIDTLSKLL